MVAQVGSVVIGTGRPGHHDKTSPLHLLVFLSKIALVEMIVPYLENKNPFVQFTETLLPHKNRHKSALTVSTC